MPPHCDTMDGPVVSACIRSLEECNINHVLPWLPEDAEDEMREVFDKVIEVRKLSPDAAEVADLWFFETAVRLHRQGEGAPYTGLKPAGLDWGPVVPMAERAMETGDPSKTIDLIINEVRRELRGRFDRAWERRSYDLDDVPAGREYVQAMLGFVLFSHHLYQAITESDRH